VAVDTRGAFVEVARGPGCALGLQLLVFATLELLVAVGSAARVRANGVGPLY
jgi:hypothetical protein